MTAGCVMELAKKKKRLVRDICKLNGLDKPKQLFHLANFLKHLG